MITAEQFALMKARVEKVTPATPSSFDPGRESDLHDKIIDYCRSRGWLCFHGRMDKKTFRIEGEPDFHILGDGGRSWLIECKRAGGKFSTAQCAVIAQAKGLGHTVHAVFGYDEFLRIVTVTD